jgi:alpha/beta superfamily hydrolase
VAQIRANFILPARRRDIELQTSDGLALVGELALPEQENPVARLICLHPLPTHGGMMDSHILRKAAWRLPALAGPAVLRFQHPRDEQCARHQRRQFEGGVGERHDVAAAIEFAEFEGLPSPRLLGWSFGTALALRDGRDPGIMGAVLLSPPLGAAGPTTCGSGPTAASR